MCEQYVYSPLLLDHMASSVNPFCIWELFLQCLCVNLSRVIIPTSRLSELKSEDKLDNDRNYTPHSVLDHTANILIKLMEKTHPVAKLHLASMS